MVNLIELLYFHQKNNLALYDQYTGLYNRNWFERIAKDKYAAQSIYVVMVDVNGLKHINDTLGHHEGNKLLTRISESLKGIFTNPTDKIVRWGGDEFVVLSEEDPGAKLTLLDADISYGFVHKLTNESLSQAIREADEHMYIMKKRNHIGRDFDNN